MNNRFRIFFAPEGGEGGAGGSGSGAGAGAGAPDLSEKLGHVEATYLGDLDEAFKQDDFTGIEDVKKLYAGYKGSKTKIGELEQQLKDSLIIPGENSTHEQVKDFFKKIGMPEKPEGYDLSDFDMDKDEMLPTMKKNFMDEAFKSGLTKNQARKLWTHEAATYGAIKKGLSDQAEKLRGNFDQRYDMAMKEEFPDTTKRAERITKDKNLYKEFNAKYGMGAYFEATGLAINPKFIHAIATMYENISSDQPGGGSAGKHETELEALKRMYPSMF